MKKWVKNTAYIQNSGTSVRKKEEKAHFGCYKSSMVCSTTAGNENHSCLKPITSGNYEYVRSKVVVILVPGARSQIRLIATE